MTDEVEYFRDPQVGKLLDLVLQLATEVHVLGQRAHALEALLVRSGVLGTGDVDSFAPDAEEERVLNCQRDELIARLVRIIVESGPAEHPLRDQWEAALRRKAS
jgi:hypothetical protein